jgi:hypothetical protein
MVFLVKELATNAHDMTNKTRAILQTTTCRGKYESNVEIKELLVTY